MPLLRIAIRRRDGFVFAVSPHAAIVRSVSAAASGPPASQPEVDSVFAALNRPCSPAAGRVLVFTTEEVSWSLSAFFVLASCHSALIVRSDGRPSASLFSRPMPAIGALAVRSIADSKVPWGSRRTSLRTLAAIGCGQETTTPPGPVESAGTALPQYVNEASVAGAANADALEREGRRLDLRGAVGRRRRGRGLRRRRRVEPRRDDGPVGAGGDERQILPGDADRLRAAEPAAGRRDRDPHAVIARAGAPDGHDAALRRHREIAGEDAGVAERPR